MLDIYIALALYFGSLCFLIWMSFRFPIESDQRTEYDFLLASLSGKSIFRNEGLVSSCLLFILPQYLAVRLGFKPEMVFRVVPNLFFALFLSFAYLTARLYLPVSESLLATGVSASSFYFCFAPLNGRVSVAFGVISALWFFFLSGHLVESSILVLALMLSHYATFLFFCIILTVLTVLTGETVLYSITLTSGVIWYGLMQTAALTTIRSVVINAWLIIVRRFIKQTYVDPYAARPPQLLRQISLVEANKLQKAEAGLNLAIVGFIIYGLRVGFPATGALPWATSVISVLVIGTSLLNPVINNLSGVARFYTMALPVLSIFAVIGAKKTIGLDLFPVLLVAAVFAVSGILHRAYGWSKRYQRPTDRLGGID